MKQSRRKEIGRFGWDSKLRRRGEGVDMDWKRVGGALNPDLHSNSVGGSNQGRLPHISYTGQGHHQPTFKRQRKKIFLETQKMTAQLGGFGSPAMVEGGNIE